MAQSSTKSSDFTSNQTKDAEMYLSEDILQGEEVPFYIVWHHNKVKRITLQYEGFESIIKMYNAPTLTQVDNNVTIESKQLAVDGYLGGVLKTPHDGKAQEQASLRAKLELEDGSINEFVNQRKLYSVRAEIVECPTKIKLPLKKEPYVRVRLVGAATAIIEIVQGEGLKLGLPPEVLSALERFALAFKEGIDLLRSLFPKYEEFLNKMLDEKGVQNSFSSYVNEIRKELDKAKEDEEFMQSLAYVIVSAILEHGTLKDSVLLPLTEYFASTATTKAYLESPFLSIEVPKGGGNLDCSLILKDLLGQRCGDPLRIRTQIETNDEKVLPLNDIIRFERK